ncbi:calcium-binding and coiled-coil domain-containing protein 2 isoform X3 [Calypte anna]|uniref:calcium-binding and coiled-coil domain-containing protein 2 isoform X3 n=1 Tax=Calypte anna TaxID=9244 RepID=UPI0011C359B6|nr:calcium-binding and coiled-coil domain-containing protein 2 isoform X3 [Calypte anna]
MDENSNEPPTSALLLESCHFSQVVFNNVEKFYVPGGDITCYYTLTQNILPRGKDWVGIFRVGWKTTREYYTFMWAPLPSDIPSDTTVQQQIQFKAYYLPKDDEYYQFCYVDQDGLVRGASVPFQFRAETEDDILVVTTQGEVEEIEIQNKNLREENEELKASCASLQKQNMDLQEEIKNKQELQKKLESLRSNTEKLEQELNSLKKENKHLKELGDCREAELHQLKEQIQNMTSDKEYLETRMKTVLDHMDQLQQQNCDLMKDLEEQKCLFQILEVKKKEADEENQKLQEKHEGLVRHLSQAREVSPFSVASQAQAPMPAPRAEGLLFGNPYCAAEANLGAGAAGAADIASLRKCPMCDEVFPEEIATSQYEAHVQSHLLECPVCSESFDKSKKQVFDDHVFCHGLE